MRRREARPRDNDDNTDLLHDTGFALGKGNVTTRLVLDELDFNLSSLTTGLVIIVVVVVGGSSGRRGALPLDASVLGHAIAIALVIVGRRRVCLFLVGNFTGHDDDDVERD